MILGIDASSIRSGGGHTHLAELLRAADPQTAGFDRVIVWSSAATLAALDERPWLTKAPRAELESGVFRRLLWQRGSLSQEARAARCDVLFIPGGLFLGDFAPFVTMSQNLLPFEWPELRRYGLSRMALRLLALRHGEAATKRRATATIFLTEYARAAVSRVTGQELSRTTVIPHGVGSQFRRAAPLVVLPLESYSDARPFRIVYVSIVDEYKHQWHVADAAVRLRARGIPMTLDLVGPAYPPALRKLERALSRLDPAGRIVRYRGPVPYEVLNRCYDGASLCVFASSCENLPITLLEGMASGVPIACSNRGPMPEVLGDAGAYFDPEDPASIADAIERMARSTSLRETLAAEAQRRAASYTWERCARETFAFLSRIGAAWGGAGHPLP